jgi:hypothetical protein
MAEKKYSFFALNGLDREPIEADSILVKLGDGQEFTVSPHHADFDVTIYAGNRLVVRPTASNCARIADEY